MNLDPTTILTPRRGIIETELEDELILLDPASGEMFSLNGTGRSVWRALDGRTVAGVVSAIESAYDVAPERAGEDVRALLAQLLEAGLVEVGLVEARSDGNGG
jgi:hypothetical protein